LHNNEQHVKQLPTFLFWLTAINLLYIQLAYLETEFNILKQEIISPQQLGTLKTYWTPLHIFRNTRVPWNPCWRKLLWILPKTCKNILIAKNKQQKRFLKTQKNCRPKWTPPWSN